ncbi:Histidine ammonia-lyase [compost metagenome]
MDFRAPNKAAEQLESAKAMLRAEVSFYDKDRYFAPDIEKACALIQRAEYNRFAIDGLLPSL